MPRSAWRYLVEEVTLDELKDNVYFNEKGTEDWELVAIHRLDPAGTKSVAIFKKLVGLKDK